MLLHSLLFITFKLSCSSGRLSLSNFADIFMQFSPLCLGEKSFIHIGLQSQHLYYSRFSHTVAHWQNVQSFYPSLICLLIGKHAMVYQRNTPRIQQISFYFNEGFIIVPFFIKYCTQLHHSPILPIIFHVIRTRNCGHLPRPLTLNSLLDDFGPVDHGTYLNNIFMSDGFVQHSLITSWINTLPVLIFSCTLLSLRGSLYVKAFVEAGVYYYDY